MKDDFLWISGNTLMQMRLLIEGAIVLYEEEVPSLLRMAVQKEQHSASDALDAIGSAMYDLRMHIRDLQTAHTQEVIRISEKKP